MAIALGACVFVVAAVLASRGPCGVVSKRTRAQIDAEMIAAAIEMYAFRVLPPHRLDPHALGRALFELGPNGEPPALNPDWLTSGRLIDPWGRDYEYKKTGPTTFIVLSYGKDGMPGGDREDADLSAAGRVGW